MTMVDVDDSSLQADTQFGLFYIHQINRVNTQMTAGQTLSRFIITITIIIIIISTTIIIIFLNPRKTRVRKNSEIDNAGKTTAPGGRPTQSRHVTKQN